ncbi:MAG TPA: hypothetical protein PLU68_10185, partial [Thermotogota bacterium]|nr:hypothetical protein [Thermotogota bacterium]HQK81639.1 hypothetical protein [Thermotogota bacterium]
PNITRANGDDRQRWSREAPSDRKRSPVKGHITHLTKPFGKPYAGNPHVRFEVAGEGNRERVSCQVV